MKIMFIKVIIPFIVLLSAGIANADNLQCVGMDTLGKTINVILDIDTATLNVNGDVLKITGRTVSGKGFVTGHFISSAGILVYDSINSTDNGILLTQFNAVTQELISYAYLACH